MTDEQFSKSFTKSADFRVSWDVLTVLIFAFCHHLKIKRLRMSITRDTIPSTSKLHATTKDNLRVSMLLGQVVTTTPMCLEFQAFVGTWNVIIMASTNQIAKNCIKAAASGMDHGVLLGDSGYPCHPFLLTPYLRPNNDREERYNRSHTSTRNVIERVFGVWKRKFHILHSEIPMKLAKASKIIVACAVLHNLTMLWKEPEPQWTYQEDDQPYLNSYQGQEDGRGVRAHVTNKFFSLKRTYVGNV